jgi:AMP-polyphosphate phosphotransferase
VALLAGAAGWGGLAVFDRSWYGRVLVERVERFATREQWLRAYDEINDFERRERDPLKTWKLTDEDWRNRKRRKAYRTAVEDMLGRTDTEWAPWTLVEAESKRYARVKVIETVIADIEAGMRRHGIDPPPDA